MEIRHADKTENSNNDTYELNLVVFRYTAEKFVSDLAVEYY